MILAERLQNIRFSDAKGPPLYRRVYEGYPMLTRLSKGGPLLKQLLHLELHIQATTYPSLETDDRNT